MNFLFIQYFLLLFYINSKEYKKFNTNKNIFNYAAKTVELKDFDIRTSATSENLPFFISKAYTNQTIGYSFSFDLKTFNHEKVAPMINDYTTLSLLLNPFIINRTIVGKSNYEAYKANNFTDCSFEISGIFEVMEVYFFQLIMLQDLLKK